MVKIVVFILTVFFLVNQAGAQEKGLKPVSGKSADTAAIDFERRIALVIGNATYENNRLNNPVNDANAIAEILKKYGFEVIMKTNADRNSINKAINEFGDSIIKKKGVSFFYYSGHGLQYKSQNYILPLDCSIEKEDDIEDKAVKVGKVFDKMKKTGNGLNFVVLDACRNNPYYASMPNLQKGLTDKETMPGNTSVFFATTPGDFAQDGKGNNSPFTESLVQSIRDSIEFYQVVRKVVKLVKSKTNDIQQPTIAGSPEDEFYFRARPKGSTLFVLSVGISKYSAFQDLMYGNKDATDIAAVFNQQKGLLFSDVKSYVLLDSMATRTNIIASLYKFTKQAGPGDAVVLFFSGMSETDPETNTSYFIPSDGQRDEPFSWVNYNDVESIVAKFRCKSVLFLEGAQIGSLRHYFDIAENGIVTFNSNLPGQKSMESIQLGNGLFAKVLIEGINGAADEDNSGFVTVYSLYHYIWQRMKNLSGNQQLPSMIGEPGLPFKISKTINRVIKEDNPINKRK